MAHCSASSSHLQSSLYPRAAWLLDHEYVAVRTADDAFGNRTKMNVFQTCVSVG